MLWDIPIMLIIRCEGLHACFGLAWLSAFWAVLLWMLTIRSTGYWGLEATEDSSTHTLLYWGGLLCSSGLGILSHIFADYIGLGF